MGPLGFRYYRPDGRPLKRSTDLKRIRTLAVPPAWKHVWICPAILECYVDRSMEAKLSRALAPSLKRVASKLRPDEAAALRIFYCMRPAAHRTRAA